MVSEYALILSTFLTEKKCMYGGTYKYLEKWFVPMSLLWEIFILKKILVWNLFIHQKIVKV